MNAIFIDSKVEFVKDFKSLISSSKATFYEVYYGKPNTEFEFLFDATNCDESFFRFNLQFQSEEIQKLLCSLSPFERLIYGYSEDIKNMPLPYFRSFVSPLGHLDIAWTKDEIAVLIARTRKEKDFVRQQSS